ncbi:ABC transporter permease [Pseudooceanicola lipolyticus]|uniref:ABC transporter permease n=1 Tax=Pseudooceanicola lipolyticus TaxID=2029104 RepID=A0A2M8J1Q8_9RHOB|nr:ABC transporter permease [Pseudooceanicola lipolyticus]PJE36705.1 ABC transporter permease [Pseudooceanicola lipolyticus]
MDTLRFTLTRVLKGILVLLAIAVMNFFLIRIAPGDPASVLAGESGAADPVYIAQLRERFGLDKPVIEQLWIHMKGIATLDLGHSARNNRTVLDMIAERLPATLLLTGTAFVVSLILGVVLGVLAARRVGTLQDTLITIFALIFYAMPLFWIALLGQVLFALKLGWLPNIGYATVGANYSGWAHIIDVGRHLILPATTLGLFYTALYARIMRASTLEIAGADFIKTARAKGLGEGYITRRHIARNAILPVVTLAGLQAGQIVGGAVLIETIFAWPGIGRLLFDALMQREYQVLLGVFFVCSALVVLFNIITDLFYRFADPRIEIAR